MIKYIKIMTKMMILIEGSFREHLGIIETTLLRKCLVLMSLMNSLGGTNKNLMIILTMAIIIIIKIGLILLHKEMAVEEEEE